MADRTNAELVKGLRDLADYLERYPDILNWYTASFNEFADGKAELAAFAREHAPLEKTASGEYFTLVKKFGPCVSLAFNAPRATVCKQVVTGKKLVTLPAQDAKPERTEEVEVKEWICDEPLLALKPATLNEALADPAAFVEGMTETSGTNAELPEDLKPKRNECWDMFDDGYVPTEPPAGSADWEYGEVQEYTRWKMAGGQVRHVSEELPI